MSVIILKFKDSNEISNIVYELKLKGLQVGKDFDFEYHPGRWDMMTGDIPRYTKFTFYNEKEGTWFALKWS